MSVEVSTVMFASPDELITELRTIYDTLKTLPSLAPGAKINSLLTNLVNLCVQPYGKQLILDVFGKEGVDTLCMNLRQLCSTAEGELEHYWARQIIALSHAQPSTLFEAHSLSTIIGTVTQLYFLSNYDVNIHVSRPVSAW